MSRWTDWVRKWAKDHDTSYGCALSQPACSQEYRAKYGNRKNLPRKTEKEMMGAEDKDAGEEIYILPKKKAKKKKPLIIESDSEEEIYILPKKNNDKKRLLEMSRMMGEDYNALKGRVSNEVAKIEKKLNK